MHHEIPSPEQAAELAAWWRQAFEALEAPGGWGSFTPSPMSQDPSGACTTSRAGYSPDSTVR